jgi:chorismate dehydratase
MMGKDEQAMLFGSISYLNLLPFQLFLKRHLKQNATQMSFRYRRAVPSKINHAFQMRKVNAAFISSIHSKHEKCTNLGIIAHKRVLSVLLIEGAHQPDPASATSNELAKVLGLRGKVLIGDVALQHYLNHGKGLDLATEWYKQTGLPFVFARLCYNAHTKEVQKLASLFRQKNIKIPYYTLQKEAKKREISPEALKWYLKHIYYNLDNKAHKGLKLFLKKSYKF